MSETPHERAHRLAFEEAQQRWEENVATNEAAITRNRAEKPGVSRATLEAVETARKAEVKATLAALPRWK